MNYNNYKYLIYSDLYRYCRQKSLSILLKNLVFNPGFKYTWTMRTAKYTKNKNIVFLPIHILFRLLLSHYRYKYGISIPYNIIIESGFYIGHFGGIVVNSKTVIGKNCNISQAVTIGETFGGKYPGTPIIGENVYIAPGAKIIGGITIGNNVAIGANCVVTKPVPENAIVVGIPGEVISMKGSGEYINNIDY